MESCPDRVELPGNGTSAHPGLRSSDLLAFLPFQVSDRRLVLALYVMTNNLLVPRGGGTPTRFDLAPERFRLRIAGAGPVRHTSLTDPLVGHPVPDNALTVVSASADSLTVDVALTDAPRLLVIDLE